MTIKQQNTQENWRCITQLNNTIGGQDFEFLSNTMLKDAESANNSR
jgi:hypothetical protein